MSVSIILDLDRYGMLGFVIGHSTKCSLGLLHGIGIRSGFRKRDLSETLRLISVSLRDRDACC